MEIVRVEDSDLQEIEGNRCRTFRAVSEPLTADGILNHIHSRQRKRVIVICNTVSQSQGLFRDLEKIDQNGELNITLLHSIFLPEDRAKKETDLKEKFAQDWPKYDDGTCYVLISTQVIEAGINITCEVMHTHLCPMNSLLQRAGRCARFSGEQGEVYVYWSFQVNQVHSDLAEADLDSQPEAPAEKKHFLPYSNEICELTWQVLQAHTESAQASQHVGFRTEETWINQVHSQEDLLQHQRRSNNRMNFEQQFDAAFRRGEQSAAKELIRFVDSRNVFVWEEPIFIDDEQIDPKKLLAFSVPTSNLCKVWREFKDLGHEIDWVFKRIEAPLGKAAETYSQPVCTPITSREDLITSFSILVNPRYVHYDDKIGLLIGVDVFGNRFSSPKKQKRTTASEYKYRMDNYVGHLALMWKCWREPFTTTQLKNGESVEMHYASVRDELLQAGGRFIKTKIFPQAEKAEAEALFEYLVCFAVLTHDLSKLQVKWQEVMRGWQAIAHQQFGGKNPRSHLLAHTDYNPEDKKQRDALKAYEKKHKRSNHAIESAFLSRDILKQSLSPLLRANLSKDLYPARKFDLSRFETDQTEYLQLYLLVVRALRLCDQRSVIGR